MCLRFAELFDRLAVGGAGVAYGGSSVLGGVVVVVAEDFLFSLEPVSYGVLRLSGSIAIGACEPELVRALTNFVLQIDVTAGDELIVFRHNGPCGKNTSGAGN